MRKKTTINSGDTSLLEKAGEAADKRSS